VTRISRFRQIKQDAYDTIGLDSAGVLALVPSSGTTYLTTLDSLPISNISEGDKVFVQENQRLYISPNGTGWYNVSYATPTISLILSDSGVISFDSSPASDSITATVTVTPDGPFILTLDSDGDMARTGTFVTSESGNGGTIYTITTRTTDSGALNGDFALTWTATDGHFTDTETIEFSINDSHVYHTTDSGYTTMLIKAFKSGDGYQSSLYDSSTFETSNGTRTAYSRKILGSSYNNYQQDPKMGSATPYSPTKFSYKSEEQNGLVLDLGSGGGPSGDFTIEGWFMNTHDVDIEDANGIGFFTMSANSNGTTGGLSNNICLRTSGGTKEASSYQLDFGGGDGGYTNLRPASNPPEVQMDQGKWYHIAVVRNSNDIQVYVNGKSTAISSGFAYTPNWSTPVSISANLSAYRYLKIGAYRDTTNNFQGYIRDFRYAKTAVYTGEFTPPSEPFEVGDVSNEMVLLYNGESYCKEKTGNSTITANKDEHHSAPIGPYQNGRQMYTPSLHGVSYTFGTRGSTNAGYMEIPNSTGIQLGTGDFTIEGWYHTEYAETSLAIASFNVDGGLLIANGAGYSGGAYSGGFGLYQYSETAATACTSIATSSTMPPIRSWFHFAVTRSSGTVRVFINGEQTASATDNTNYTESIPLTLGYTPRTTEFNYYLGGSGTLADFRIEKGNARYTSAFNPPTKPLPITQYTTVHLNAGGRELGIYDAAGTCNINLIGGTKVSTEVTKWPNEASILFPYASNEFEPYTDHEIWESSGAVQYAEYMYGPTSYISPIDADVLSPAEWQVYTLEGWIYPFDSAFLPNGKRKMGGQMYFGTDHYSNNIVLSSRVKQKHGWKFGTDRNGDLEFSFVGNSTNTGITDSDDTEYVKIATGSKPPVNQWNHVALCRDSDTVSMFLNGSRVLKEDMGVSVYWRGTALARPISLGGGNRWAQSGMYPQRTGGSDSASFRGYMQDWRVVQGKMMYDSSSYDVPTEPFTL